MHSFHTHFNESDYKYVIKPKYRPYGVKERVNNNYYLLVDVTCLRIEGQNTPFPLDSSVKKLDQVECIPWQTTAKHGRLLA